MAEAVTGWRSVLTRFPDAYPRDDPAALWTLQRDPVLGPRDTSKTIFQPQFHDNGPQLRNTSSLDGAFVEMSQKRRALLAHSGV